MCQVDEEYNGQLERREGPSVSKKCMKCKEATAALVIRAGDAFCRGCFKDYFIHKFRAMLGKNRVIFPGEKVLLAVSGGPASCSMLNQVQEGMSHDTPKKLRFTPGIVYIDEGGAIGLSMEERQRNVAEMEMVFRATGFPFHIVPLEQVLNLPSSVLEPASSCSDRRTAETNYKAAVDLFIQTSHNHCLSTSLNQADLSGLSIQEDGPTTDATCTQSLQRLFGSVKTLTAKEDLLHTLRQHLLIHTARCEGYSKVMLGESCTRLAVKLLANISLGRGAQLAMDTGFSDPRYGDVVVVRPMRDYSAKEISFYNHMFNISSVFIPSLDTKTPDKASIQRLTESFVIKLQADFPSTVSTIYRTSDKLQTACPSQTSCSTDHSHKCLLCMCALDTTVEEASAFQATMISEQLSQRRVSPPGSTSAGALTSGSAPSVGLFPTSVTRGQCCSSGGERGGGESCGGGCSSTVKSPETVELKSLLCYSCRLTIKDMSSVEVLPQYIISEAQKRRRRSQMKEEISEFLLNEDDDDEEEEANPS